MPTSILRALIRPATEACLALIFCHFLYLLTTGSLPRKHLCTPSSRAHIEDTLSELLHAKCSQGSWGDRALRWLWHAAEFEACGIWHDVLWGKEAAACPHLDMLPAGQGEVGTGQGDGTFSRDPAILLKSKRHSLPHSLELRQYKCLGWTLSPGFSGSPIQDPEQPRGKPRQGFYSQVRDAWRFHLREGCPVGAEGGRAVNQRAVLSQTLCRRDVESVSPGPMLGTARPLLADQVVPHPLPMLEGTHTHTRRTRPGLCLAAGRPVLLGPPPWSTLQRACCACSACDSSRQHLPRARDLELKLPLGCARLQPK